MKHARSGGTDLSRPVTIKHHVFEHRAVATMLRPTTASSEVVEQPRPDQPVGSKNLHRLFPQVRREM